MTIETKKCTFCAEEINIEAIKCKHCGEFVIKPKVVKTFDLSNRIVKIPSFWLRLKKMKWLGTIIGILFAAYFFGLLKIYAHSRPTPEAVENFFDVISSITEFSLLIFVWLLYKYLQNFKERFWELQLFLGLLTISFVMNFFYLIKAKDSSGETMNTSTQLLFISMLLFTYGVQFIVGKLLKNINNDNIYGLKLMGKALYNLAIIYPLGIVFYLGLVYIFALNRIEISPYAINILSIFSIATNFILIHYIEKTFITALINNESLISVQSELND